MEQIVVPAGGVCRYQCKLLIGSPGPFAIAAELHLFDNKGIRSVTISVKGTGIDDKGSGL